MVPKGDSQRYCYETEEQSCGKRQGTKEKDEETRSVVIRKSFANSWSQKNKYIQIAGSSCLKDELIPGERSFIFLGNSSRPKYKETQE